MQQWKVDGYRLNLKDLHLPPEKLDREIALREQAANMSEQLLGVTNPDEDLVQEAIALLEIMHQAGKKMRQKDD